MKIIAGFSTLIVGILVAIYGFVQPNYLLVAVGAIVAYTGIRVLKAQPHK